jgi:hypothetical protein
MVTSYYASKKVPIKEVVKQQPSVEKQKAQLVVDVHGRISEAICTYRGCDHRFSAHGVRGCKRKHPSSKIVGVFTKYP